VPPSTVGVGLSIGPAGRAILEVRSPIVGGVLVVYDPFELVDQWGPEKVVLVSDRRSGMRGVLVIDNTARGLGKGGTRMSPSLTVGEVARLARTMTWKWAAVDLFHGGAKAGILGDPRAADKERMLRAFARALSHEVPSEYVFGLDMGLAEEDAAIFVDELNDRGVSTGLPRALGGLPYDQLGVTGFGVAEATDAAAQQLDLDLRGARVAIQGFGAVGRAAAQRLSELGAVLVAVSTAAGWAYDADGLDLAELASAATDLGDHCVTVHPSFSPAAQGLLTAPVDVLIPAAREDTVGVKVARSTTARLVVEGANLPTTEPARQILHERGVVVVPDFIANAGGIVAAAHSTDARYSPFVVEPTRIFPMISDRLRGNTARVLCDSVARGITPRQAAMDLAQSRVLDAMVARGFRPDLDHELWSQPSALVPA
jgi:glutamate dehydrogenase (NAD(P)+)